ncbi:phosphotransferase [Halobacteria archaeon HArc-gm2]|nr:phosphotransferase [Halobacteria archaeon HArc-gm2]
MGEFSDAALDDAFPDRTVAETGETGPSWNETNETVEVQFADGETVFCKVAVDGDGSRIARERAVISFLGASSEVRVPDVVAADPDAAVPSLVTSPLTGRNLAFAWADATPDERERLARTVGETLADLHAVPVGGHGHVVGGDADGLDLETAPWPDVLLDRIELMRDLAISERFDHHFDEVAAAVAANRDLLDGAPAALLHGDPAQPNVVRDEGDLGLLDWEIAYVGDPTRELVRARSQQFDHPRADASDRILDAFHDGYRERASGLPDGFERRRPVYEAVNLLTISGFFENWADHADESAAALAEWLEDELEKRLAAI